MYDDAASAKATRTGTSPTETAAYPSLETNSILYPLGKKKFCSAAKNSPAGRKNKALCSMRIRLRKNKNQRTEKMGFIIPLAKNSAGDPLIMSEIITPKNQSEKVRKTGANRNLTLRPIGLLIKIGIEPKAIISASGILAIIVKSKNLNIPTANAKTHNLVLGA